MKRILLFALVIYLLLIALPLPLVFLTKDGDETSPPIQPPVSDAGSSSPSSSPQEVQAGVFRLLRSDGTVYEVADKAFVLGTVSAEMYPSYHTEALKAQAVASYTYYSAQRNLARKNPDPDLKGADFADTVGGHPLYYSDDDLKERWGDNFDAYHKKITEAVDAVFGRLITYDNEPILAAYHAISAGVTEDASVVWGTDYPYLKPVASPGDKLAPDYQTIVSFTPDQLREKLANIKGCDLSGEPASWLGGDPEVSASGTVTKLLFGGAELTGRQLRDALDLRSACFTVAFSEERFTFTAAGYGHGVGMSQYGADYMARQGSTFEEILQHYYTGVVITAAG